MPSAAGVVDEKGSEYILVHTGPRELDRHPLRVAKFSRFANELYQHILYKNIKENREVPEVYIRIGPAGTGKSRWLDDTYGLSKWIEAPDNTGGGVGRGLV